MSTAIYWRIGQYVFFVCGKKPLQCFVHTSCDGGRAEIWLFGCKQTDQNSSQAAVVSNTWRQIHKKINNNLDRKHQMGWKNIDSSCGDEDLPHPPRFANQESDRLLRREAETVPGCQRDSLYSHTYLLFVALFRAVGRRRRWRRCCGRRTWRLFRHDGFGKSPPRSKDVLFHVGPTQQRAFWTHPPGREGLVVLKGLHAIQFRH